ncbi:MAG: dephospho-CoA kinase [Planctomycetota bacterium]
MRRPFRPVPPLVLGLVGGVASGKSAVSAALAEAGLVVLDADRVAREVLASPELGPDLVRLFGPGVLGPDGPDRALIADRVFRDPALRGELEALTHPRIRARLEAALARALAEGSSVVLDVPLLLEGGLVDRCDVVVFVDVPDPVRRTRAQARGLTAEDWRRRERAQAPLELKRARADRVVDNSGDLAALRRAVAALLAGLDRDVRDR